MLPFQITKLIENSTIDEAAESVTSLSINTA